MNIASLMDSLLFSLTAHDPLTFMVVAVLWWSWRSPRVICPPSVRCVWIPWRRCFTSSAHEGERVPPVDPEELKRRWIIRHQRLTYEARRSAQSQEADRVAVAHRFRMISMLAEAFNQGQLLTPWKHCEGLDDAAFRVAATFLMQPLRQHVYQVPGDSMWGFDPNAFVQKLIEETGFTGINMEQHLRVSKAS